MATTQADPDGNLTHSTVRDYSPATGALGKTLATDPGNAAYMLFGSDPSAHRLLAAALPGGTGTTEHLLTLDPTDGHQVADVPMDESTGDWLVAGRVDSQRHRGALLAWRDNGTSSVVLPVDTGTGQVGTPVPLAPTRR